jgi:UDP-N-acetyl-2-amino-2-deoxyglucuronate dehydrogenase
MPDTNAKILTLKNANVRWFLSVNMNYIQTKEKLAGKRTFSAILVDGKEIEFSGGFADLHTIAYQGTISGNGYGLEVPCQAIEIIHNIRHADRIGAK